MPSTEKLKKNSVICWESAWDLAHLAVTASEEIGLCPDTVSGIWVVGYNFSLHSPYGLPPPKCSSLYLCIKKGDSIKDKTHTL